MFVPMSTSTGEGMATGENLAGSERIRNLRTVLHAKAKRSV